MIFALLFLCQMGWGAFEPSPLEDPMSFERTGSPRLVIGYEDLNEMVGYTYLDLVSGPHGISVRSSGDREGLYREFSIRYTEYLTLNGLELILSPSYLSCSAKGDLGEVGAGKGFSFDIGVGRNLRSVRAEAVAIGLIGGIRYNRHALKRAKAKSYWERPSENIILELTIPVERISGQVKVGIWNRNSFLRLQVKPTRNALVEAGWISGKGVRGGFRFGLMAELGDFSLRYRHLIGRSGIQSIAFDITVEVR